MKRLAVIVPERVVDGPEPRNRTLELCYTTPVIQHCTLPVNGANWPYEKEGVRMSIWRNFRCSPIWTWRQLPRFILSKLFPSRFGWTKWRVEFAYSHGVECE
jgi:hypothetical protein